MSEKDAVIAANAEFYKAFSAGDVSAMDALWARRSPVACIHPGGPGLASRSTVMQSWTALLTNENRPKIRCQAPSAFVNGESAFVICYEELDEGVLVATNLFVREDGAWRMVHHQAGPTAISPARAESAPRRVLH